MIESVRASAVSLGLAAGLTSGCLGDRLDVIDTPAGAVDAADAAIGAAPPPTVRTADPPPARESVAPGQRFKLADNGLGDEGFASWLMQVADGGPPVSLDVRRNGLTAASLRALAASSLGPTEHLRLDGNPVGDDGAAVLGSESKLAGVMTLGLADTGLGPRGVVSLLGPASKASWLLELDLSKNPLGDAGVQALAAAPKLATVTYLDLSETGLTDNGAVRLAASPYLGALENLMVSGNELSDKGVTALEEALGPRCAVVP